MTRLACPGCGFSKELPAGAIPNGTRVTCPKCRNSFIYVPDPVGGPPSGPGSDVIGPSATKQAVNPPIQPPIAPPAKLRKSELTGIGELFAASWDIYKKRVVTLSCLMMMVFLPFALLAGALFFIHSIYPDPSKVLPLVIGVVIGGIAIIGIVSNWSGAAVVLAVADEKLSFREALYRSWPNFGSFLWLSLLMQFIIQGGFMLLVIPGLLFLIWFSFSPFIFADNKERGMNAILKSKAYVEGHFLDVTLRFFLLMLIAGAVSAIPMVGPLFLFLFWPFALILTFLVYQDLREIKGDVSFPCSTGEKCKWLGAGVLGHAFAPIVLFAFLGSVLMSIFSLARSIDTYSRDVITAPSGKAPELPPLLKMAHVEEDINPVSTTAAQYDALLASQTVDFEDGIKHSVGPAAVQLGTFWVSQESPHVWLKVRVAPLPNLELDSKKFAKVVVEHVLDKNNRNVYDAASHFERDFFQRLNLSGHDASQPYMETIRDVYLQAGTKESDIVNIAGALVLTLPEKIETLTLDESKKGKEVAGAGATVTLKEMSGEKVSFEYRGNFDRYIKTTGYDQSGKALPQLVSQTVPQGEVTALSVQFKGDVRSVKVVVAAGLVERKYPFELKQSSKE